MGLELEEVRLAIKTGFPGTMWDETRWETEVQDTLWLEGGQEPREEAKKGQPARWQKHPKMAVSWPLYSI